MGEEEKKPEEKKVEEKKEGEAKTAEEKKEEENKEKPSEEKKTVESNESKEPPPPEEIVLRVYMHCEGCARKVKRCLKGFEGVEDVLTDCKTHKVVVKGIKADPLKVLERVQRKSHRQVELLSPIPKPPAEDEKKSEVDKANAKPEEKKEEQPQVIIVVLKVRMHCEACAQEMRKRIQRMKGVEVADPDLKSSQVTVKGVFDPPKLVEYIYKRTGKQAVILKQEPEKKEEEKGKEEKKGEAKGGEEEKKETKEGEEAKPAEEETKVEPKKNEFYYYPPKYDIEYVYAPQIFSDENPNACSVM
ncbi:hypothetical protein HHK36_029365 [Tetracentron sinense]|uniref:HMA domain-containing protein n=1 Tax=Tetracentron sinense TaxID=13715 RepID=A0A834YDI7_TETSI|nr:hypothetical protein HHK36_029365 [Tetracentron sinense]